MGKIYLIVEGDGETEAAPLLIRRILGEIYGRPEFMTLETYNAHGNGNITTSGGLERFLELARRQSDCLGVVVLLDTEEAHLECPPDFARSLGRRTRDLGLPFPVVITCATCEYESWFLYSPKIAKIYLKPGSTYTGDPEKECSSKGWLERHMKEGNHYNLAFAYLLAPAGRSYLGMIAEGAKSAMRTLKRPEPPPTDPYKAQPLPTHRPISVSYRQSSEGQIGNVSTTLQTIDMIEHLIHLGWLRENIIMVDMDAGVSGTKKIEDRPGMAFVVNDQIEHGQIGVVAAQDVDRFFRDVTQIETNKFIDACKRNHVLVLTPNVVYDFAHPVLGPSHIKLFREEAQRAADYLEFQIRGRLVKSRHRWSEHGARSGRKIAPGFMVDMRDTLPDGTANPDKRKYVKFEPWADIVLAYFQLFRAHEGNLDQTLQDIEAHGPAFPSVTASQIPAGYIWRGQRKHRSPITGQLVPSSAGLHYLLTNVAYIGHWIHKGAIVRWNNHPAIIPLDLFMYAYNRLSPTDFLGDPNPDYVPHRPWVRHDKAERQCEPPTYAYLTYTDDLPAYPHKLLSSVWNSWARLYQYQLSQPSRTSNVWNMRARIVDKVVDGLLLERLKATTLDEAAWRQALHSIEHGDHAEVRRIETAIRTANRPRIT